MFQWVAWIGINWEHLQSPYALNFFKSDHLTSDQPGKVYKANQNNPFASNDLDKKKYFYWKSTTDNRKICKIIRIIIVLIICIKKKWPWKATVFTNTEKEDMPIRKSKNCREIEDPNFKKKILHLYKFPPIHYPNRPIVQCTYSEGKTE